MMRFNILGTLELVSDGRDYAPTAPKVRAVLALLLLRANSTVSQDSLFDWLWGERPPRSAATTMQTYIYQIRSMLAREGLVDRADEVIATRPTGYTMMIEPEQLDLNRFNALVECGRTALAAGDAARAAQHLRDALALWRGPALADVDVEERVVPTAAHLEERRMRALELRIEADSRLGHHSALAQELRELVATHPLNEWFHAQLIAALNRCGRRADALQAYRELQSLLKEELGLDPTPELQGLQRRVLDGSDTRLLAVAG